MEIKQSKMKTKYRFSYSILSKWESGNWWEAVAMYYKIPIESTTTFMEEGKKWHKQWEEEVKETGCLPKVFGDKKLNNPETEKKIEHEITENITLVGVLDLIDGDEFTDYKSGKTGASSYLSKHQLHTYLLLANLSGYNIRRGFIRSYNQYENKAECAMMWFTPTAKEEAINWVIDNAMEMISFIEENNIAKDPKGFLGIK